jgi:CCR4-NOT transcription complex subunit 1
MQAVQQLQQNKANVSASVQINQSSQLDMLQIETATELFRNLIMTMDTEGRYLILNAIANQLRYPNSHTHYFSFIILYLFAEATQVVDPAEPFVKLGCSVLDSCNHFCDNV